MPIRGPDCLPCDNPEGFPRDLHRFGRGSAYRTVGDLAEQRVQALDMAEFGAEQHDLPDRPIHQRFGVRLSRILPRVPGLLPGLDRAREVAVMQIGEAEIGQ